jgi:hypothetical protein
MAAKKGNAVAGIGAAPLKAKGRTLAEFETRGLWPAERELVAACREGRPAIFNDGNRPVRRPAKLDRHRHPFGIIRGDLLRFLCLGGDERAPVHELGVQVMGAWIEAYEVDGTALDLDGCTVPYNLSCVNCHIFGDIELRNASCCVLNMGGCWVNSIYADGLSTTGDIFFDSEFQAESTVRVLGARINGDLYCDGGTFGIQAPQTEGVPPDLASRRHALNCQGMSVTGGFFFRDVTSVAGIVNLSAATITSLADDAASWKKATALVLDGFNYNAIASGPTDADTRIAWLMHQNPEDLIDSNFCPQPWVQLIRTLRRMGHREAADDVAVAFQRQQHAARKSVADQAHWTRRIRHRIELALHTMFGLLAGYGYKPLRLFLIMFGVQLAVGLFYLFAAINGGMGPSSPLVFQNPAYAHCKPDANKEAVITAAKAEGKSPPILKVKVDPGPAGEPRERPYVGNWYYCNELPGEYTTFQPFLYSLDLILPLVELQQDKDWSPVIPTPSRAMRPVPPPAPAAANEALVETATEATTPPATATETPAPLPWQLWQFIADFFTSWSWGQTARVVMWAEILFGWISSLLLVAVLTGLTNREKQDDT